jgi:hypothetical protein
MEHNGHTFMYSNFSGFGRDVDALRAEVLAADGEICRQPKDSVLVLVDVRGTTTSTDAVDVFRHSAARTKGWVIRQAIVGVTGIQKILARAVARFSGEELVLFDNFEEAKDWLVSGGGGKGESIRGL